MKKYFMLAVMMISGTIIFAQTGKHRNQDVSEIMKTELSLNDNQYASIKDINRKYATQYGALRKDSTQARDQKRDAVKALHQKQKAEISAVLTPEQNAKWKSYKAEQKKQRKEAHRKAKEQHKAELKSTLKLSDDQAKKMEEAGKQFHEQLRAAKKNGSHDRAEFKKLKEQHETAVKGILDEDQFQKWLSIKQEKRNHGKGKRK